MAKTKRPATPSPLTRAERAVVRAAMSLCREWHVVDEPYDEVFSRLEEACDLLAEERQKARRAGR